MCEWIWIIEVKQLRHCSEEKIKIDTFPVWKSSPGGRQALGPRLLLLDAAVAFFKRWFVFGRGATVRRVGRIVWMSHAVSAASPGPTPVIGCWRREPLWGQCPWATRTAARSSERRRSWTEHREQAEDSRVYAAAERSHRVNIAEEWEASRVDGHTLRLRFISHVNMVTSRYHETNRCYLSEGCINRKSFLDYVVMHSVWSFLK